MPRALPLDPVSPKLFCPVQGGVGLPDHVLGLGGLVRVPAHADAYGELPVRLALLEPEALLEYGLPYPLGRGARAFPVGLRHYDGELLSAVPGDDILLPHVAEYRQ